MENEKEARAGYTEADIFWKRPLFRIRENCDVCVTSIFNFHWTCGSCGFVSCIDCYDERKLAECLPKQNNVVCLVIDFMYSLVINVQYWFFFIGERKRCLWLGELSLSIKWISHLHYLVKYEIDQHVAPSLEKNTYGQYNLLTLQTGEQVLNQKNFGVIFIKC